MPMINLLGPWQSKHMHVIHSDVILSPHRFQYTRDNNQNANYHIRFFKQQQRGKKHECSLFIQLP